MTTLTIVASPSESLALSNKVFVAPNSISGPYIMLNDAVFFVQSDSCIALGQIALNSLQRRFCSVSELQRVNVVPYLPPENSRLTSLSIELNSLTKYTGLVDVSSLVLEMKNHFKNMPFTVGQEYICEFKAVRYVLKVILCSNSSIDHVLGAQVRDSTTRSIDQPSCTTRSIDQPSCTTTTFGVLTETTEVRVTAHPKAQFKLKNIWLPGSSSMLFKSDFDFTSLGIGGLDNQFAVVFRRAFASRLYPPQFVKELGIQHIKGILLFGPPGTGKTLMARQIGKVLNCEDVKVVNGPELFNKYVGETEKAVRDLFKEAEKERDERGDESSLHLLIFDEIDAMCKARGSGRDGTGVHDSVVNQLLSKIDGVDQLNNVLIIGMTNRKDLIDEAFLRPGRLELQIEVSLPDDQGRQDIFRIHTNPIAKAKRLGADVSIEELASMTKNYTGAEIAGVVRVASSYALDRNINHRNIEETRLQIKKGSASVSLGRSDFIQAISEVKPAFGSSDQNLMAQAEHGIIDFGSSWSPVQQTISDIVCQMGGSSLVRHLTVSIDGLSGSGKSSLAAHLALMTDAPFLKMVSPNDLVGYNEVYKVNYIRKVFDDAMKSPYSVVILDDLELLMDYSPVGQRYSTAMLMALRIFLGKQPPVGHRLLVIATTSQYNVMRSMQLTSAIDNRIQIPLVNGKDAVDAISKHLGLSLLPDACDYMCTTLEKAGGLPMKEIISIFARALSVSSLDKTIEVEGLITAIKASLLLSQQMS